MFHGFQDFTLFALATPRPKSVPRVPRLLKFLSFRLSKIVETHLRAEKARDMRLP
jgi:hypothetical protein